MHSGMEPGTAISAAHSSGTAPNPISRMAVAGNVLVTSAVAVKSTLMMSSSTSPLRSMSVAHELLRALRDLGHGVLVDRRRPAQTPDGGSSCHGGSLYRDRPEPLVKGIPRPGSPPRRAPGAGRGGQGPDLAGLEGAPLPGRQVRVAHRPDAGADEPPHRVADGAAHAADLAVASLVDDEAQDARGQHAHLGRRGEPVVELDALAQRPQRPGRRGAAGDLGHVLLGHAVGRVGEQLGQRAVVGQDEQALGVAVQPPDGEDPRLGAAPAS